MSNLETQSKLNIIHSGVHKRALTERAAPPIVIRMNRKLKYALLCFAMLNFTFAGVSSAAAYLDPGTGSIIFQSVIASVATGLAVFATAWRSILAFFRRAFGSNTRKHSDKD
jgi:hypothetical protein